MFWPPLYKILSSRLVIVHLLHPPAEIETLFANQVLDILWQDSIHLQNVKGGFNLLQVLKHHVLIVLTHVLIFEKVTNNLLEDAVECIGILLSLLFVTPALQILTAALVVHWLAAHRAPIVAPFDGPALDAALADMVSADELGARASLETHWAIHLPLAQLGTCGFKKHPF